MKVLSYSPSVEAYVSVTGKNDTKYYDISDDIIRAQVTRKVNAASSFNIELQNKDKKYNKLFTPWDKIVIYAVKDKRYKLLSGYITNVSKYSLVTNVFKMNGYCTLYRLQQLYWDSNLASSQKLLGYGYSASSHAEVIMNLLVNIAGYNSDDIYISQVPEDMITFARDMYEAKLTDYSQAEQMIKDFYDILQKTSPQLATGGATAGAADFSGNTATQIIWNFCISQGFSPQAAAAVIGNAMQESGCDPAKKQSGGAPGRGLFQWEIDSSRFNRLQQIAASMNTNWSDPKAQLTLFQEELPGEFEKYTGKVHTYRNGTQTWWSTKVTFNEWKQWTDIRKATECLERVYMRPSKPMREKRYAYAQAAYNEYAGV